MDFEVYTYLCRIQSTYVHTGQFMVLRKESVCRSLPSKTSLLLKGGRGSGPQKYNAVPRPLTAHIFNYCLVFSPVLSGEILMDAAVIHGSCGNPARPSSSITVWKLDCRKCGKTWCAQLASFFSPFFSGKTCAYSYRILALEMWYMRQETARYERNWSYGHKERTVSFLYVTATA